MSDYCQHLRIPRPDGLLIVMRHSLHFDGQAARSLPLHTGVPQGSPLSPILFILCFADGMNLVAFGEKAEVDMVQLEKAWKTWLQWASKRGMSSAAEKSELSELMHIRHAEPWKEYTQVGTSRKTKTTTRNSILCSHPNGSHAEP
jgi:hypothetical protein